MKWLNIFVIVGIITVLGACSSKDEIKAPPESAVDSLADSIIRPDQEIRGANITLYNGPVKTTDIKADYIEKFTKQDSTLAWGLDVTFFDKENCLPGADTIGFPIPPYTVRTARSLTSLSGENWDDRIRSFRIRSM